MSLKALGVGEPRRLAVERACLMEETAGRSGSARDGRGGDGGGSGLVSSVTSMSTGRERGHGVHKSDMSRTMRRKRSQASLSVAWPCLGGICLGTFVGGCSIRRSAPSSHQLTAVDRRRLPSKTRLDI